MKILYLMHVNWRWIRQRPQVLAELLAQRHEVHVMHYAMFHPQHQAGGPPPPPGARVLQRLPGRLKRAWAPLQRLDQAWLRHQVLAECRRFQPDLLWVCHPELAAAAQAAPVARVVYDCMDDHLAFHQPPDPQLAAAEQALVQRAELTLFSSATLAERVARRSAPRRSLVVHNGVATAMAPAPWPPQRAPGQGYTLGYFGTLSHWFDWPLVLQLLQALPEVQLRLAGPLETALPSHPRVQHVGVLAHDALAGFAAGCDALCMPFVLSPLIEAVDPVKLYEYIALGRPALAPRYGESERFAPLVSLYDDAAQAIAQVRRWMADPATARPDAAAAAAFVAAQRWAARMAQIEAALG